jgi:energy-coupling factor transport system ATP-binding protein
MIPQGDADSAILLESLSYAYQPDRPILRELSFEIPRGQLITITGDNGAGKTTLARHLIGLLRPTAGRVMISGEDIARKRVSQIARTVGYAYQNPELQIFNPTVHDEIAFGLRNLGLSGDALESAVASAMAQFGLSALAGYPPAMLSFSGRRLVALAGIAAARTPILVLDEPTVGLDAAGQARVDAWLADRHTAGATIVLITHDMEFAARRADRVVVMQSGRIAADGAPSDVFSQADLLARAGLEPPFAIGFAARLSRLDLAADLTPEGAGRAWLERLA